MYKVKTTTIVKQDINFLDKPIWFQEKDSNETSMVWKDINGYVYRAGYKVPDKVDALFLMYMLLRSQQAGYKKTMIFSKYEIIKACDFATTEFYYNRLEDSLKRWLNVSVEFQGTFYDGVAYKTISFGIIDSYKIREEDKRLEIRFSPEWLLAIKESGFFKEINFKFYKTLKRPISRRLFEILCKSFQGRTYWEIELVKLGTKLTLSPRQRETKNGVKEVVFPSDVLVAIKPAINEINANAQDPVLLKEFDMKPTEAFCISHTLRDKIICFTKHPLITSLKSPQEQDEVYSDPTLLELFKLTKRTCKTLRQIIAIVYKDKGADYVRSNIDYANQRSDKSYVAYLKKALSEDWAKEQREEKSIRYRAQYIQRQQWKEEEKQRLEQKYEQEYIKTRFNNLPKETQEKLKLLAEKQLINEGYNKRFLPKIILITRALQLLDN